MKISFIFQLKDLGIIFGIGIILGIFYGILNIINNIKEYVFIRILCDIIFTVTATITFILLVQKINFGSVRGYLLVGYILGFIVERISIGKLFAKGYKKVYNFVIKSSKKFYHSKIGQVIFR